MERIFKAEIPCYLLLIGVDNLKHINLRHGREYGSQILCRIADTLEELVGAGLRIYRVNGDCFAVNLPVAEPGEVEEIYQQLRDRMAEHCTLSAGVVSYHGHPNVDSSVLYQYAEEHAGQGQADGKNIRWPSFPRRTTRKSCPPWSCRRSCTGAFRTAFPASPCAISPRSGPEATTLFGAEALLRYHSPTRGAVSPQEFIPVLEQTGMICPVGLWVLETALEQCRVWRETLPELHISVNMSYVQLSQKDISTQVLELLEKSGLPGDALTLEVTESMQLQDYPSFNRLFYQWKQAGIEISVDDFGTGYSSLGYLKNLDIDEIKIDRCFVSGIQHSAYNYRLLNNMVELARTAQIRVCCEGVETRGRAGGAGGAGAGPAPGLPASPAPHRAGVLDTYIRTRTPEHDGLPPGRRSFPDWSGARSSCPETCAPPPTRWRALLEALDEVVYVSDLVTYELYYLNPRAGG